MAYYDHGGLLIVIEAPGKIAALAHALSEIRVQARIKATGGSLFNLPKQRLGLDPATLLPCEWEPEKQRNIDELVKDLATIKKVIILTDADIEGELIASQVNAVLRHAGFSGEIKRATARSLSAKDLSEALASPRDIDRRACVHAIARRAIDRGIGFLFSDATKHHHAIAGRVRAQILGSIGSKSMPTCRVTGLHSIDPAWRIYSVGNSAQRKSMVELMAAFTRKEPALFDKAISKKMRRPAMPPPTGPEAILLVANKLGIPVKEAELLLQRNYEAGRLSYPRTDSRRYGVDAQHWLKNSARAQGLRVRSEELTWDNDEHAQGAHDSLYPLDVRPQTGQLLEGIPANEAAQVILSRRSLVSISQDAEITRTQIPQEAISAYLRDRGLPPLKAILCKDEPNTAGWLMLERGMHRKASVEDIPTDQAILERIITDHIGRPSTAVKMCDTLTKAGLIKDGGLSKSGWANLYHLKEVVPSLVGAHNLDAFLEKLGSEDLATAIYAGYQHLGLSTNEIHERATKLVATEHTAKMENTQINQLDEKLAEAVDEVQDIAVAV